MRLVSVRSQKKRNAQIFESAMGMRLDYDKPRSFNEKLNWIKFYWRDPLVTKCSAKDTVRGYIREVLGNDSDRYLTSLEGEGVYFNPQHINFEDLPDSFVLKANNGSGTNIICPDKSKLDKEKALRIMVEWMKPGSSHYYHKFEWGYKNIKPAIICEEFLGDMGTVRDYKVFCFNGQPRFIYVSNELDEHKKHIEMDYLTLDWRKTGYVRKKYKPPKNKFPKPVFLNEIVELSRLLCRPFPFVRVDFIEHKNKPKIIEMTFYPAGGTGAFEDIRHDYDIGDMLKLPKPKNPARFFEIIYN